VRGCCFINARLTGWISGCKERRTSEFWQDMV
jgi:hypothetical protein